MRTSLNVILKLLATIEAKKTKRDMSAIPDIMFDIINAQRTFEGDFTDIFDGASEEDCVGRDPSELQAELQRDYLIAKGKLFQAHLKRKRKMEARLGHLTK
jgi:hypothetical protein